MDTLFDTLKKVNAESVPGILAKYDGDVLNQALSDLTVSHNPPICVLFASEHTGGQVSRNGDLLVGFYTDEPTQLTLTIGGQPGSEYNMQKGEFVFAYDGCFAIPLISLRFHDVRVDSSNGQPIYCVYACLQLPERRQICQSMIHYTLKDKSRVYYIYGMCSGRTTTTKEDVCLEEPDRLCLEFPDLTTDHNQRIK